MTDTRIDLHDPVLPNLAAAMNPDRMRRAFQETLFSPDRSSPANEKFRVTACDIVHVKYKPGRNCMIGYRLSILDKTTGHAHIQLLTARVYERGGSPSRFRKAKRQNLVTPRFAEPVMHFDDLDMVVWAFPNDRKLHNLARITDAHFLRRHLLPDLLQASLGTGWRIHQLTHDLAHYVPEHTCTVRLGLQLQHEASGERMPLVLFGKTYYNDEGDETFRHMEQLWQSAQRRTGKLAMARPLGYHPETRSLWQFGIPGSSLSNREMATPGFVATMPAAAATVAALHATPLNGSNRRPSESVISQLERVAFLLTGYRPSLGPLLHTLVDRLTQEVARLDDQQVATLHGDLHLKNFFVRGRKVYLIDMDRITCGSPLWDIGSFIAGVLYRGQMMGIPEPQVRRIIEAFVRGYEAEALCRVPQPQLRCCTAVALLNERAFRCLTRLKSGRLELVDHLIRLAVELTLGKRRLVDG